MADQSSHHSPPISEESIRISSSSPSQPTSNQENNTSGSSINQINPTSSNENSISQSSSVAAQAGMEAGESSSATEDSNSQQDSTTNSTFNLNTATPFPIDPGPELRRGGGGFAALVDAFLSGFRQAAVDARNENTSSLPRTTATIENPSSAANEIGTQAATSSSSQEETLAPVSTDNGDHHSNSNEAQANTENSTNQTTDSTTDRPRTLFFRMPFGPDGRDALLAFTPGPIPSIDSETNPTVDLSGDRGNGLASGFHLPHSPIFVPLGASPLPFSFLFDAQTNTAWPIANITNGPPGAMPIEQPSPSNMPQFVTGPPFRIALNVSYGPPPEAPRPDPERASRFVASLERADAELRGRMARLEMGDIGDYGGSQKNEGGDGAALGCGICLDEYGVEDRPEWIGGQNSIDEEVVAVPCAGHHTLHHRCLYEWLANTAPNQWTCPFCRAPLDKEKVDQSASEQEQQRRQQQRRQHQETTNEADDNLKKAESEAKARTLREEVRLRERARGWRCDSPACLPRYPESSNEEKECVHQAEGLVTSDWPSDVMSLISLLPCRHKLHLDCLCTSMKLEQADLGHEDDSDEDSEGEEEEAELEDVEQEENTGEPSDRSATSFEKEKGLVSSPPVSKQQTVGKWVTCPTCRHEAWAELPVRRKPKRVEVAN